MESSSARLIDVREYLRFEDQYRFERYIAKSKCELGTFVVLTDI
jgi:hypothetical protein